MGVVGRISGQMRCKNQLLAPFMDQKSRRGLKFADLLLCKLTIRIGNAILDVTCQESCLLLRHFSKLHLHFLSKQYKINQRLTTWSTFIARCAGYNISKVHV